MYTWGEYTKKLKYMLDLVLINKKEISCGCIEVMYRGWIYG
jgi:hypothetical protein